MELHFLPVPRGTGFGGGLREETLFFLWGIMYVLCTLVVLTIHSLFKNRQKALEPGPPEAGDETSQPKDRAPFVGEDGRTKNLRSGRDGDSLEPRESRKVSEGVLLRNRVMAADHGFTEEGELDREVLCQGGLACRHRALDNVPDSRKRAQVRGAEEEIWKGREN